MAIDPVELINKGLDDSLIPAYNEIKTTLRLTSSKDLLSVAFGFSTYKDLVNKIPNQEDGGIHKYAEVKKLSRAKELGVHIALLDAYISKNKDIKDQSVEVAGLILGEAQNPNDPESIHFPNLIPSIDLVTARPNNLPESVLDKDNKKAFQIKRVDSDFASGAKAMIFGGVLWKDITSEQRVLMLEDFLNVATATTDYIAGGKTVGVALVSNRGAAEIFNYGLYQQLIPTVCANGGNLQEIIDASIEVANRRSKEKRGNTNSAIDKSPKDIVLQNVEFALQQTESAHGAGNKDYPDPKKAIEYFKSKTSEI